MSNLIAVNTESAGSAVSVRRSLTTAPFRLAIADRFQKPNYCYCSYNYRTRIFLERPSNRGSFCTRTAVQITTSGRMNGQLRQPAAAGPTAQHLVYRQSGRIERIVPVAKDQEAETSVAIQNGQQVEDKKKLDTSVETVGKARVPRARFTGRRSHIQEPERGQESHARQNRIRSWSQLADMILLYFGACGSSGENQLGSFGDNHEFSISAIIHERTKAGCIVCVCR